MTAAAKETQETVLEVCPICNVKDLLVHFYKPENAYICDSCFTKLRQKPLPLDEYDLHPDEMTKEQAAEKAQVSVRAVEKWIASGQLAAEKTRRRIAGAVRPTTILKIADVENLLKEKNESVQRPVVERETSEQSEQTGMQASSQQFGFNFMQMIEALTHQTVQPRRRSLTDITGKLFLDVDELHDVSGVSITELKRAIAKGIDDGSLHHFSGKNRKSVYRAEQLDTLLENLPPTDPPKPPKRKAKGENEE